MSEDDATHTAHDAATPSVSAKPGATDEAGEPAGGGKAPTRQAAEGEANKAAAPAEQGPDLRLPGQLPALKGVQAGQAPGQVVKPTQPHGQFELEGDVKEADAEAAVQAVFPAIRDCYVELRQRAQFTELEKRAEKEAGSADRDPQGFQRTLNAYLDALLAADAARLAPAGPRLHARLRAESHRLLGPREDHREEEDRHRHDHDAKRAAVIPLVGPLRHEPAPQRRQTAPLRG